MKAAKSERIPLSDHAYEGDYTVKRNPCGHDGCGLALSRHTHGRCALHGPDCAKSVKRDHSKPKCLAAREAEKAKKARVAAKPTLVKRQLEASHQVIDRQKTHGKFTEHARVSQALKDAMRQESGWARLDPDMREALDMAQHKVARILTGDPTVQDHWDDVVGYASRVAERLAAEREARLK